MVVRLAAFCAVAMMFVYSSSSVIKSGNGVHAAAESWSARLAAMHSTQSKLKTAASGVTILGTASTYNPTRPDYRSGGMETASGEQYDPAGWTAAIQIDLRDMFGGIRFGKD
jgi:rare lipoprotein A